MRKSMTIVTIVAWLVIAKSPSFLNDVGHKSAFGSSKNFIAKMNEFRSTTLFTMSTSNNMFQRKTFE